MNNLSNSNNRKFDESNETVQRFELLSKEKHAFFFDIGDFEVVIDHYINLFNYKKANSVIDLALRVHPWSIDIQIKKALTLIYNEKPKEAIILLLQLEKREPYNEDIIATLCFAYVDDKKPTTAFEKIKEFLLINNQNHEDFLKECISIFENYEYYEFCLQLVKIARQENYNNSDFIFDLGYFYEKIENFQQSILFYNQFLDIFPYSEDTWYNLGILYSKMRDYDKAIDCSILR